MSERADWADRFGEARRRVGYRLTFSHLEEPRGFHRGWLEGPDLPDAREPGRVVRGEWCGDDPDDELSDVEAWFTHFAAMVVGEAVHEALEWFHVDGKPWLDPHGEHESAIHVAVDALVEELARLRAGKGST